MSAPAHELSPIDLGIVDQDRRWTPAIVEIVAPVHNEEGDLAASVRRLDAYLAAQFPHDCLIPVAVNASTHRLRRADRTRCPTGPVVSGPWRRSLTGGSSSRSATGW